MATASTTPIKPDAPEEWRAIPGYEGLYEASSHGGTRRIRFRNGVGSKAIDPRPLKQCWAGRYLIVGLYDESGKRLNRLVHRLIAATFLGAPPEDAPHVAHLDGDRGNNCAANLHYVSAKENERHKEAHGTKLLGERCNAAKLSDDDVEEIRRVWRPRSATGTGALAVRFGVDFGTISSIVHGHERLVGADGRRLEPPPTDRFENWMDVREVSGTRRRRRATR